MSASSSLPLLDIVQTLRRYYDQLRHEPVTEAEFLACVQTLPQAMQKHYLRQGCVESLRSLAFCEYCLDCRGYSRTAFLRLHLPTASFVRWQANMNFWDTWFEFCEGTGFAAF